MNELNNAGNSAEGTVDELNKPASLETILAWVATSPKDEVLKTWTTKTISLSNAEVGEVINTISLMHGIEKRDLRADWRDAEEKRTDDEKKRQAIERSEKRKARGIREVKYRPEYIGYAVSSAFKAIADKDVFQFGGQLARVQQGAPSSVRMVEKKRSAGEDYPQMSLIRPFTKETLRHKLERHAVCLFLGEEENTVIKWPDPILQGMLDDVPEHIHVLTGIVEHPFVSRTGRVISTPGYDPNTGLFLDIKPNFVEVPSLTRAAAQESLDWLHTEFFADFPFDTEASRAAAVAAALTTLEIKILGGRAPGFMTIAPTQGTGKTALFDLISRTTFGRPVPAASWSDDDTEMSKHILAVLREGQPLVLFDNLPEYSSVESAELAKAMTSETYSGRLLGHNRTIEVPSSTVWAITGNSIYPVGDFNSRYIPIILDAKTERPDRRHFQRRIDDWSAENRLRALSKMLTIIAAYHASADGWIPDEYTPTRFGDWDRLVRLPLLWAGSSDPADAFERNHRQDPKILAQAELLDALHETFGTKRFTARDVVKAQEFDSLLDDALDNVLQKNKKSRNAISHALSAMAGRVIKEKSIEKYEDRRTGNSFKVRLTAGVGS